MSCLELDDEEALKIAGPMVDDTIAGVSRREYKLHSAHFSVSLKSLIGPDEFLGACDQYESDWGRPQGRELVAVFRKQKSFTLVWNQQFDSTDEQVVAITTIALKGGRYFLDYFLVH